MQILQCAEICLMILNDEEFFFFYSFDFLSLIQQGHNKRLYEQSLAIDNGGIHIL